MRYWLGLTLGMALCALGAAATPAAAAPIFFDDFESGVAGWTKSTTYGGASDVATSSIGVVSGVASMEVAFDAPPGSLSRVSVDASHNLNIATAGTYGLQFFANTVDCSGCLLEYTVSLDGTLLKQAATFGATQLVSLSLGNLGAGLHTLALGVTSDVSFTGHFAARFDDVSVAATPIPAALPLFASALGGLGFVGWRRKQAGPAS